MNKITQKKIIGERVTELRKLTNLSRRAFCDRYQIPHTTFRDWEQGKNTPSIDKAITLVKALKQEGIKSSLEWILSGKGSSPLEKKRQIQQEQIHPLVQKTIENNRVVGLNQKLYDAVKESRKFEIEKLINNGANLHKASNYEIHFFNDNENSLLHLAVVNANIDILKLLLSKDMDINIKNKRKESILHFAALKGNCDMINYLLKKGIHINAVDIDGDTPFGWSVYNGQLDIAELLVLKGCQLHHQNNAGNSPLHWAAYKGHFEIIKFLLKHKANSELKNYSKKKPIDLAIENGHIECVQLLASIFNI